MYPGGNAVNVAVHASRLSQKSAYIGCLGDDTAGDLIYESLLAEKVDVSRVRRMKGENAYCDIRLVDGDRVFGDFSGGMVDKLVVEADDLDTISQFDLVHTSVYSFLDDALAEIRSHAKFISYDFSNEWDKESLRVLLPMLDFALISNPDADADENEDLLVWAAEQGPELLMVTSGEQGAMVYDGKNVFTQPIVPVEKVVDTLGAGDAFATRFLTLYLEQRSIEDALHEAADYAARNCTQHGAFGHGMQYIY